MDEDKGKETNSLSSKNFARIHEKIQSKYDEMQKRLEKSRSVDSLNSLSDEILVKEHHSSATDLSVNECRHSVTQSVIEEEEIVTKYAQYQEFQSQDSISELVEEFLIVEQEELDKVEGDTFFGHNFTKSLESLDDIRENDGNVTPTSRKISIRERIHLKLSSAKERRRKTENSTKENKRKEVRQKVEKLILTNTTKSESISSPKSGKRTKSATVSIALIETFVVNNDLLDEKYNFYCRFRLGTEKYKSKTIKNQRKMKWQELFNLSMFDEYVLEISLWDKDVLMGRTTIDLFELEKEKTHNLKLDLESDMDLNMQLFILLTISGISLISVDDFQDMQRRALVVRKQFDNYHLSNDSDAVGLLSVVVYGAKGLSANECYCVLELDNERVQTHTDGKTTEPNWMKVFNFTVNDVTSILDLTIHDEKKSEDIGKVSIPLLHINNGCKKWYALKDGTQRERAKGNNPRILLEMSLSWNLLRAATRVINPKEPKHLQAREKLDRHKFSRNLARAKIVLAWITYAFGVVKNCFEWESRTSNVIALTLWLIFCFFFKMWMLPLLILAPFYWYKPEIRSNENKEVSTELVEHKSKEEKTTLRQKINSLQEMVQSVQNFIGKFASLGESIKNLFNFSVPFLSYLAIFAVLIITFVMFLIPVKYIFMIWAIHKFTRKILRPNRIPNNEILDLLSRVPDDETLLSISEIPLEEMSDED